VLSLERFLEHGPGYRQGLEAATCGIEYRVQNRGNDRNHHDFRNSFWRLVRRHRRQHLDLEIVQRQVGPARDQVLSEIPLPAAGPTPILKAADLK
jgi:hypothetical protein